MELKMILKTVGRVVAVAVAVVIVVV